MISPKLMCNQHLLGEHGEIHKHRHNFVKGHSIAGRIGQIEPVNMSKRHDELAIEMINRNMNHKSPYNQPDLSKYDLSEFTVNQEESLVELAHRCPACRVRISQEKS